MRQSSDIVVNVLQATSQLAPLLCRGKEWNAAVLRARVRPPKGFGGIQFAAELSTSSIKTCRQYPKILSSAQLPGIGHMSAPVLRRPCARGRRSGSRLGAVRLQGEAELHPGVQLADWRAMCLSELQHLT